MSNDIGKIIAEKRKSLKRLKKYAEGIMLLSTNSTYEPMVFTNKDIEELPVKILGKVVELRAKL